MDYRTGHGEGSGRGEEDDGEQGCEVRGRGRRGCLTSSEVTSLFGPRGEGRAGQQQSQASESVGLGWGKESRHVCDLLWGTVKDRKGRKPGFDAADEKVAVCGKKVARKTAAQWVLESRGEIIGAGGVMGIQMARRENRGLDGAVRGKREPFIFRSSSPQGSGGAAM